jgi:hypothetical protein
VVSEGRQIVEVAAENRAAGFGHGDDDRIDG